VNIVPLPALADNYIWLLHDHDGNAVVVDPGDAEVVERELQARRLQLRAILLTHHHHDHTGGVAQLLATRPAAVFAPRDPRIRGTTRTVGEGDVIALDTPGLRFTVMAVPGHTLTHVAFFGEGLLLCGDTLFSLGCGRLFEGTPAQMLDSLDRIAALPATTRICPAHEYTEANGRFARMIEPSNQSLVERCTQVANLRARQLPTLPATLAEELRNNPFLRVDSEGVRAWDRRQHAGAQRAFCAPARRQGQLRLMARFHRALRLTPLLLLAACASVPTPRPKTAAVPHRVTLPPPATFDPGQVQARIDDAWSTQAHSNPNQLWKQLRASFAMDDCHADPSIMRWARRYTRNRHGFENRLRTALPKIAYIQQTAAKYGIPGEFALLPWVESRYRAVPGNGSGSTGAWQITSRTATAMGLRMDERYDARLDLQASSTAVMQLLQRYHQRFDDWRMVNYAYNAGEFATARFVDKQGAAISQTAIPTWPGHAGTQRHLSQLLAIACVVRAPGRFGVTLPGLREAQQLTAIPVEGMLALDTAARYAGVPVETLKRFNAGFLDGVIDASTGAELLLPMAHARQFRAASANAASEAAIADNPRAKAGN